MPLPDGWPDGAPFSASGMADFNFELVRLDGVLAHFRGRHDETGRKILLTAAASDALAAEAEPLLDNELALAARLDDAWAVRPRGSVWWQGGLALVYHDNAAQALDQRRAGPVDIDSFLSLAIGTALALRHMHQAGLLHKNVKPSNILVDPAGGCRLAGFGIAGAAASTEPSDDPRYGVGLAHGQPVSGTPAYMSPEHTGRNRCAIDARSDLYSLGVVLYELLAGRLPFDAGEHGAFSAWAHYHLASAPQAPHLVAPGVPEPLSLLVMKLLEKNPDQRYLSAAGLEADLRRCRHAWLAGGRIDGFELGAFDRGARLRFPDRLYARDAQLRTLRGAFDNVQRIGGVTLALVGAASGMGKSALLAALRTQLQHQRACLAVGKVDQYRRALPYAALTEALRGLVLQLLDNDDALRAYWRQRLLQALGANAELAVSLVPELGMLLGLRRAAGTGPAWEQEGRSHAVLRGLLNGLAIPGQPLVLMIDDAQWLDPASVALLGDCIDNGAADGAPLLPPIPLLLVLTWRHQAPAGAGSSTGEPGRPGQADQPGQADHDGGSVAAHAVKDADPDLAPPPALAALWRRARRRHDVALAGLDLVQLERLLAEALGCGRRQVAGLAALAHEKTGGNPFFVRQFIQTVIDDRLLTPGARDGVWHIDLASIRARGYTANVVQLVLRRMERMPPRTRLLLGGLACLGRHGSLALLCGIYSLPAAEVEQLMAPALEADILALAPGGYVYTHDQVQEAAYAMMPERAHPRLHYTVGRQLAQAATGDERDDVVFAAAEHLDQALHLITGEPERQRYAALFLLAARKARRAGAYSAALAYLDTAGRLLHPHGAAMAPATPPAQPLAALAYDIVLERAGCEFCHGNLETASSLALQLLAAPGALLPRAEVWRLQVEIHLRRCEYGAAVDTALLALRRFGIELPRHPSTQACRQAYQALRARLLAGGDMAALVYSLPPLRNREVEASIGLLAALSAPASVTSTRLYFLQLCQSLNLMLDHGVSGASAVALARFGVLVGQRHAYVGDTGDVGEIGDFGDRDGDGDGPDDLDGLAGLDYTLLARALVARHGYVQHEAATLLPLAQLGVWSRPLAFAIDSAKAAHAAALDSGDLTTACFVACQQVSCQIARGDHLDRVAGEIACALLFLRQANFRDIEAMLLVQQQFVDALRRPDAVRFSAIDLLPAFQQPLSGDGAGAGIGDAPAEPGGPCEMATLAFWGCLYKGIAHYLAGEYEHAASCLERAGLLAWSAPGQLQLLDYHLYSALTLAALTPPLDGQPARRARMARIARHGARLDAWAARNPGTFADKAALVQAELARLEGNPMAALGLYESAACLAGEGGYDQSAALAHELAAGVCRVHGHRTAFDAHMKAARDAWRRCGALAKVRQLELADPQGAPGGVTGADAGSAVFGRSTVSLLETAAIRDLDSVIRSARALSEEISVNRLVRTLMTIALEHAGAQRGLLIRMHGDAPFIEACATTRPSGVEVELMQAAPGYDDLPAALLHTAIRSRQCVGVDDAGAGGPFQFDPYLQRHPACAAICIPMLKQSQLIGILYLENRLAAHGFTAEHTRVLELLAAQAAVSLETARLYADLLAENVQRRRIEKALRASEATLLLGEQISHTGSWRWQIGPALLDCSLEFCRIFGFDGSAQPLAYRAFLERIHPDDRQLVQRSNAAQAAQGLPLSIEYRIVLDDGAVRFVASTGMPADEAEAEVYVGTVTDITERRAADNLLRAAQADLERVARATTVGQLTASIAHEINQPLMSIASNAGASLRWLNRQPPQLDEARAGLLEIAGQSRRAGDMIQSLQALTRKTAPACEPVELHETVRHILHISRNELERREVALALDLGAPDSGVVGDAVQLQQVLLNLVINAIEAMDDVPGGARLLSIVSSDAGAGKVRIAVSDTGLGLAGGTAARIFEPFYTTKENGMGMGLSICRSIIEAHGGGMSAEAMVPHGARFSFVLPLAILAAASDAGMANGGPA